MYKKVAENCINLSPLPKEVMFLVVLVCLYACLFVCPQDYLHNSNERIYMKLSPEVCLRPRNNPFNFVDDPHYDRAAKVCSL